MKKGDRFLDHSIYTHTALRVRRARDKSYRKQVYSSSCVNLFNILAK